MTKQFLQKNFAKLSYSCLLGALATHGVVAWAANPNFASAAKPAVAWSSGSLKINGTDHVGSANVLPGHSVETLRASGQLYLADGSRLRLGAETRLRVESSSLQLASGLARVDSPAPGQSSMAIQAGELEIHARSGVISRPSPTDVVISAMSSPVEVRRQGGPLLAMVRPGETLSFAFAQATAKLAPTSTNLTGTVTYENGKYYLVDEVSNLKVELQSPKSAAWKNKRVRVTGELTKSPSGPSVLQVREVARLRPAASTVARASTSTGLSKTVVTGIIVTTGAIGGASLALVNQGTEDPISR